MQQRVVIGGSGGSLAGQLRPDRLIGMILGDVSDLYRFRYVLANFVTSQLKVRYQRSVLGFFWTLLNPILMMSVMAMVFSQIVQRSIDEYVVYLFSGMIPWQFFAASIENGSRSLVNHEYLIRKIQVQKLLFPLADVMVAAVNMCFAMSAMFVIIQFFHSGANRQLALLPLGIVMMAMFTFGLSLIAMTLVTRFRDFEHMINVVLQAFYFACPILYLPENLGRYRDLLQWNPMTHLLAFFQCAFYYGQWPNATNYIVAGGSALGAMFVGYVVYKRHENEYIFFL